jgi:peptidyl-prolyl cis-trans isomerase C
LTENNINKVYKNYLKSFKPTKEYNASHILVKEKKDAENIIKKLNKKINFSELANEFSIGPSGKNGGELGWFSSGKMVPEFEKAAINLNLGEITQNPVKTQFGFHIIKLNGSRISKPKKQNQIETNIRNMIKRKVLKSLEKELKKDKLIIINKFEDVAKKVNR